MSGSISFEQLNIFVRNYVNWRILLLQLCKPITQEPIKYTYTEKLGIVMNSEILTFDLKGYLVTEILFK